MYKNTSDAMQSRALRAVTHDTKSDLDPSAFKGGSTSPRDAMIARKREVEDELRKLSARIQGAKANAYQNSKYQPPATFARWQRERADLLSEINSIDNKLREMSHNHRLQRREVGQSFDHVFTDLAKKMLASDVYERIAIAAYHRLGEAAEVLGKRHA